VSNAEYSPYSVSNYTVMMLLMLVRKSCYIVARTHSMNYSISDMQGREMQNLTIGVIGTGRIGQAVIRNLSGFGCRIIGYDPYPNEEMKKYMEYVDISGLYKESDVISLHVPYFQSNYHMINKETIEKMKDGVIILNAARGELIDTSDLIDGLESGKIGGAGIDCFENESGIIHKDHLCNIIKNRELAILKSFPNVIVTPHVAFFTDQAAQDMVRCSLNSLYLFNNNMENRHEIKE
jgi:D-lactate dehydrogenase